MKFEGDKMILFNMMIDYVIEEIHNLKNNEKKITYFIYNFIIYKRRNYFI